MRQPMAVCHLDDSNHGTPRTLPGNRCKDAASMSVPFRILEQIDATTSEQLLAGHRRMELPAGHLLIFQADWGSEVYLLESGLAKARSLSMQGDEAVLALMGSGALMGDLALLSP